MKRALKPPAPCPEGYFVNELMTRAAALLQPEARQRVNADRDNARWLCYADVAKQRSGNAAGAWTYETGGPFFGPTEAAAIAARCDFIQRYMIPRRSPGSKRPLPPPREETPKRTASNNLCFAEPCMSGPRSDQAKPGPGRGHTCEPASSSKTNLLPAVDEALPDINPTTGHWLQQISLKKQWQTRAMNQLESRVQELEGSLARAEASLAHKEETVSRLREKVMHFPLPFPHKFVNLSH